MYSARRNRLVYILQQRYLWLWWVWIDEETGDTGNKVVNNSIIDLLQQSANRNKKGDESIGIIKL